MTSEEMLNAESIIKEWFWQPDSWHRKSVVRYYESAPIQPDVLQLVIAYLKQQETDRLFILNKELPLGETWKATDAWFQTSPSDKWAGTESTKIRIYQAFKPKADESDGPYTVENGCKYLVTHEFHWDVEAIPTLPASSSGVNYTLQGVTRDKETGLYGCVIEKRKTVQQDVELYDTAKTIFEVKQEEQHLGVKASEVATTGQQASAGNGVLIERQLRKNPDCTTDVINEVTKEEPVSDAQVVLRKTIRGTWKRSVQRNQVPDTEEKDPVVEDVGESVEREKTPGNRRNVTTTEFESAASEGDIELSGEHDLSALEHADRKHVVLKDGSQETPEPQTLTIEDVEGVKQPLPIADGQTKPEGFSGADDQAGGAGRKLTRRRIVINEETGQRERELTERTSIPYKKNMTWSDDNSDHEILVFRNQKTVPTVKTSITVGSESVVPTNTTITVNINEFGLFDGVYHYTHTVSGGRSGEALAWSIGPKNISAKYYYFNKKGKLCHRVFEGTVYKCYGRSNHVANELYNQDAITPAYLPQVGWVTHMGDGLFTHGTRYTLTKVGDEVDDDDSSQSSQS